MRADEYVVEKLKEVENKNIELEANLKLTQKEYKDAVKALGNLRKAYNEIIEIIGRVGSNSDSSLKRHGSIYIYVSDVWGDLDNLSEEEARARLDFLTLGNIIKEYREQHPAPQEEAGGESE